MASLSVGRLAAAALVALALTACGGGGDSPPTTPPPAGGTGTSGGSTPPPVSPPVTPPPAPGPQAPANLQSVGVTLSNLPQKTQTNAAKIFSIAGTAMKSTIAFPTIVRALPDTPLFLEDATGQTLAMAFYRPGGTGAVFSAEASAVALARMGLSPKDYKISSAQLEVFIRANANFNRLVSEIGTAMVNGQPLSTPRVVTRYQALMESLFASLASKLPARPASKSDASLEKNFEVSSAPFVIAGNPSIRRALTLKADTSQVTFENGVPVFWVIDGRVLEGPGALTPFVSELTFSTPSMPKNYVVKLEKSLQVTRVAKDVIDMAFGALATSSCTEAFFLEFQSFVRSRIGAGSAFNSFEDFISALSGSAGFTTGVIEGCAPDNLRDVIVKVAKDYNAYKKAYDAASLASTIAATYEHWSFDNDYSVCFNETKMIGECVFGVRGKSSPYTIPVGDSVKLDVVAVDANGREVPGGEVTLSVPPGSPVKIDAAGKLSSAVSGRFEVTAIPKGGKRGTIFPIQFANLIFDKQEYIAEVNGPEVPFKLVDPLGRKLFTGEAAQLDYEFVISDSAAISISRQNAYGAYSFVLTKEINTPITITARNKKSTLPETAQALITAGRSSQVPAVFGVLTLTRVDQSVSWKIEAVCAGRNCPQIEVTSIEYSCSFEASDRNGQRFPSSFKRGNFHAGGLPEGVFELEDGPNPLSSAGAGLSYSISCGSASNAYFDFQGKRYPISASGASVSVPRQPD